MPHRVEMLQGQAGNPARGMADLLPGIDQHLLGLAASAAAAAAAEGMPGDASSDVQPLLLLDALLAADAGPPQPLRVAAEASPAAQHAAQAAAAAGAAGHLPQARSRPAAAAPAAAEVPCLFGPLPQLSQPPRLPQQPLHLPPGLAFSEFLSIEGAEARGAIPTALALLPFSCDHPGQWLRQSCPVVDAALQEPDMSCHACKNCQARCSC